MNYSREIELQAKRLGIAPLSFWEIFGTILAVSIGVEECTAHHGDIFPVTTEDERDMIEFFLTSNILPNRSHHQ